MNKWEYHVEYARDGEINLAKLNVLGAEGWELCSTVSSTQPPSDMSSNWPGVTQFYFKRLKKKS